MRSVSALVTAFTICAAASPSLAAPSPMFDQFERLCLNTHAEPAAVARAATSTGADWEVVDDLPPWALQIYGGPFNQVTVRSRPALNDDTFMLVSGLKSLPGNRAQVCTLSGPIDAAASSALRAWLGDIKPAVGPGPDGAFAIYEVLETSRGRRAATKAEVQDRANFDKLIAVIWSSGMGDSLVLSAIASVE